MFDIGIVFHLRMFDSLTVILPIPNPVLAKVVPAYILGHLVRLIGSNTIVNSDSNTLDLGIVKSSASLAVPPICQDVA